jgi:uncharacterized membrane protein YgdD (TMEM256/DUF423 family)
MATSSSPSDFLRKCAGLLGATGVGAGAFGAHALKEFLNKRGQTDNWKTAVLYQLFHAAAVLGVAALCENGRHGEAKDKGLSSVGQQYALGGQLMTAGTILFSGSIYFLCLGIGPKPILGPTTPIGGLLMIGGWLVVGLA